MSSQSGLNEQPIVLDRKAYDPDTGELLGEFPPKVQMPHTVQGEPYECRGYWMTADELKNYGRLRYWWLWPILAAVLGLSTAPIIMWLMGL